MIVFESSGNPVVRSGEFEVASRRIAARAFPYAGEAGGAQFRFDPVERRFLSRSSEGTVLAGPHEAGIWRTALLHGPAGPVLVGPCSAAEEVRGSYRAAAEGARASGRAVYLLEPEAAGLPREAGSAVVALFVWFPGFEPHAEALAAATAAGITAGWILPFVPGWTATPEVVEDAVGKAAAAGARFLSAVPLAEDGQARRVAFEAASASHPESSEALFDLVHHGDAGQTREALDRLRECCARRGLATVPPRPVGLREPAANAAAAGRLEEKAEAASGDEHRAALLHAAARWIDESGRDLAPIAREGNFGKLFPFGPDLAREAEEALLAGVR
jgi:hypothetical protein